MNKENPIKRKRKGTTNLNLKNKRFGKLVVLEEMPERKSGHVMWRCICDCGQEKIVRAASLKDGNTNSCGCLKTKVKKHEKYGELITIERVKDDKGLWKWRCECDCGNETLVLSGNLILGNTKSCGCLTNYNEDSNEKERERKRLLLATDDEVSYPTWGRHVKERDKYTCVVCGYKHKRKYDLDANHLDAYQVSKKGRLNVDNGATLCNVCHKLFHVLYGKEISNKDFDDFLNEYNTNELLSELIHKRFI